MLCAAAPAGGCATAAKGLLTLSFDGANEVRNRLKWKLTGGPELHRSDFGDPLVATSYALCISDDGALVIAGRLPSGPPRWALSGSDGYRYRDTSKVAFTDGLRDAKLDGGIAGHSKIQVKGRGQDLAVPPGSSPSTLLAATVGARVQLQQSGGACYESAFTPAQVRTNERVKTRSRFIAKF